MIVNAIYNRYHEKWFLREVYYRLLTWNRWWPKNRDIDGYLCWGSTPYPGMERSVFKASGKQRAMWESGLDNSPMYDEAIFDSVKTHMLQMADVGLMSMYIADCDALASIANELGKTTEANELKDRGDKYRKRLNSLWDEKSGIYLNKDLVTGKLSHHLSSTNFYPLLAKAPTLKQAERMMKEHFYNPDEFWGKYIMLSIARNDAAFKDNNYWRGRIWGPMNFLVYLGMLNYDLPEAKADLIRKSNELLMKQWLTHRYVYENYNSITGQGDDVGNSDKFYHWGALLGFMKLIDKGSVGSTK
jgi:neutral trehalase